METTLKIFVQKNAMGFFLRWQAFLPAFGVIAVCQDSNNSLMQ